MYGYLLNRFLYLLLTRNFILIIIQLKKNLKCVFLFNHSYFHVCNYQLLSSDGGAIWRSERVETAAFHLNKDIDRLINEVEVVVTEKMEGGHRGRAMKRLRVPPLSDLYSPWTTFKVGLFSGSFLVLILAVAISCE